MAKYCAFYIFIIFCSSLRAQELPEIHTKYNLPTTICDSLVEYYVDASGELTLVNSYAQTLINNKVEEFKLYRLVDGSISLIIKSVVTRNNEGLVIKLENYSGSSNELAGRNIISYNSQNLPDTFLRQSNFNGQMKNILNEVYQYKNGKLDSVIILRYYDNTWATVRTTKKINYNTYGIESEIEDECLLNQYNELNCKPSKKVSYIYNSKGQLNEKVIYGFTDDKWLAKNKEEFYYTNNLMHVRKGFNNAYGYWEQDYIDTFLNAIEYSSYGSSSNYKLAGKTMCFGQIPNSIISDKFSQKLNIFPNPAHDVLNINSGNLERFQIVIYDVTGRIQKSIYLVHPAIVDINELKKGVYFIELRSKDKLVRQRFIKQ